MEVRRRILIADDNALIRKTLCELFADHMALEICDEAVNGQEAVEKAIKHRPHLVILDDSMPIMNGFQAAEALRGILPNVPIVLFTLYADAIYQSNVSISGITRIVSKQQLASIVGHAEDLVSGAWPT